jgi:hypothetical protein
MQFKHVCLLGIISSLPFGLAFVLAPEASSAIYGITGWNPGTATIGRLFGAALLYVGATQIAVRGMTDVGVQRGLAIGFGLLSAVATVILAHAVIAGAANAMTWSSVVIYAFFVVAWASVAMRRT